VNVNDARLWHPWLRVNRVLGVMLHTRWSAEAWAQVRVEFKGALGLRSEFGARTGSTRPVTDQRGRLLVGALGFAGLDRSSMVWLNQTACMARVPSFG
jgi:hypothetical protein